MKLKIDKKDFGGIELLPDGDYDATIEKAELNHKDGAPEGDEGYYFMYFRIEDTPDGITRSLREVFSNKASASFRWAQLLSALGQEPDEGPVEFDPEDLIGGALKVTVGQREYDGRLYNSIKAFMLA